MGVAAGHEDNDERNLFDGLSLLDECVDGPELVEGTLNCLESSVNKPEAGEEVEAEEGLGVHYDVAGCSNVDVSLDEVCWQGFIHEVKLEICGLFGAALHSVVVGGSLQAVDGGEGGRRCISG